VRFEAMGCGLLRLLGRLQGPWISHSVLGAVLRHEVHELGILGWPPVASRVPSSAAAAMAMALYSSLMERRQSSSQWWSRAEKASHLMSHWGPSCKQRVVVVESYKFRRWL
jgi:hypothetical protein